MKKYVLVLVMLLASLFLSACNLSPEEEREGEKVTITQTITKVLEKDSEGNVTKSEKIEITEEVFINPKKVATFNLGVADIFLYLGLETLNIESFGISKGEQPLPTSLNEFNKAKYPNIGTLFDPNYDILDLFNPELIILDGRTANLYDELKKRYPNSDVIDLSLTTYEFTKQKENFDIIGKIFPSSKDTLNNLITEFEEAFTEIQEVTKDYRLLFIQLNGEVISVATGKNGRYGLAFKEFGFIPADLNAEGKSENNHGTMGANFEYVKNINPEVIFIMDRNIIVVGEESLNFKNEPLISDVSAIKNNHVYYLDPTSWYTISGGIYATRQMINDVLEFVNAINK